ncbi:assimilatory sulfite reductase (NADPH) flavoprotein subunit [Thalassotalea sp. LPB0316]|uniref:assimilatory sulfite reductase (NADPH) flavoprotein subunit n=1 Tax=Thalassotalea sp. LPB0316 TaxID=2769490 RepID=UPI001865B0BD|nr:assimilatory sulfite reductase (NADPH) flavoprotein subunit [Thalassotalea sp. LPB0316]QOL27205.1 assimilatory sulfite reductase (NADPH) flavoprotein subunit [Thalassotalea sp. LPB0316]
MLSKQQDQTNNLGNAALDAGQLANLQQATSGFSALQLAWASGYLAAKSEQPGTVATIAPSAQASATLTILYASQTGNAKGVANKLADQAKAAGIEVNLKNVADYKAKALKSETHVLIVASTNGEGEPPDDALSFHEFLFSKKAPKLDNLKYSVLSLGDSSYEFFCQTGKDFDQQLAKLGATQVAPRVDCDVDYQDEAAQWSTSIVESLKDELTASTGADVVSLPIADTTSQKQYSKESPFEAELLVNQKITGRDSNKDVRHIEIDLSDSGLTYQVGDALGVWFENDPVLVDRLLALLSLTGEETVAVGEQKLALKQALVEQFELTQSNPKFVEFWANHSGNAVLIDKLDDKNALREFALENQIIDIVKLAPTAVDAQTLVDNLRKITPRLYSIASSQAEVDEEVHLTLGVVAFDKAGEARLGGASGFLSHRLAEGGKVKVFVEENNNFRLPQDDSTDVIMIGPGTGVAPFRAFMQEREARDAEGRNWMFFGDQTFTQDFLYQVEWQNYLKSGLLTKMDVAFSRDQAEKVYVQHRIKENAAEVYQWLEAGAHLYICGDANRMAKDVHQALIEVVAEQGGKSLEQAEDYLKALRSDKRYQRDVY